LPPAYPRLPQVLPCELQLNEQGIELPLDEPTILAFGMQQRKQIWQAQIGVTNQEDQDGFLLPGEGQVQKRGDAQASDLIPVELFRKHRRYACAIRSPQWLYLASRLLLQRLTDEAR